MLLASWRCDWSCPRQAGRSLGVGILIPFWPRIGQLGMGALRCPVGIKKPCAFGTSLAGGRPLRAARRSKFCVPGVRTHGRRGRSSDALISTEGRTGRCSSASGSLTLRIRPWVLNLVGPLSNSSFQALPREPVHPVSGSWLALLDIVFCVTSIPLGSKMLWRPTLRRHDKFAVAQSVFS